jgi:hypothetical protein
MIDHDNREIKTKVKAECICGRIGWLVKAGNGKDGVLYSEDGKTLCCGYLTNYTIVPNDTPNIETYEGAQKNKKDREYKHLLDSVDKHSSRFNIAKENDTEEIKITCPHCDKEIDYEYLYS